MISDKIRDRIAVLIHVGEVMMSWAGGGIKDGARVIVASGQGGEGCRDCAGIGGPHTLGAEVVLMLEIHHAVV
jgi:hypothetical protein